MSSAKIQNLFIRMDKIGDLVLSMNADQWEPLRDETSHWWVSKGMDFIPEHSQPQRAWTSFSKNFSISEFVKTYQWLKVHRPERALVFHAPWWVGLSLFLARVPVRVGRKSQWHSFLFFNFGVRQSRSRAERHESQYNIDLMYEAFKESLVPPGAVAELPPPLKLNAPDLGHDFLLQWQLKPRFYVVVHPGMAGSALNWPTSSYIELIEKLSTHTEVVVTGSALDRPFVEPLKKALSQNAHVTWLDEKLDLKQLLYVLSQSSATLAPSTGVLHLAASLGVPSFGIYSPRRVERPIRWGPRGPQTFVFVPEDVGPDENVGQECMSKIPVEKVLEEMLPRLSPLSEG